MKYILNLREASSALNVQVSALSRKYQQEGFPPPRFKSGKRSFWLYEDLPRMKTWLVKDGHYEKQFKRPERKDKPQ